MGDRHFPHETYENGGPEHEAGESSGPYVHRPEFVILEDERESKGASGSKGGDFYHFFNHLKQMQYPPLFRIFALGVSWILFLLTFMMLLCLMGGIVLALFGGFQNEELNKPVRFFWKAYAKLLVFALGLFIAAFNPPFGFSIILVYFMLQGESLENGFFSRLFKAHISRN